MGFSLAQTTTTWAGEDRSWIKHQMGYDACRSITLDLALFTPATHMPNDYIPSGVVLAENSVSGRYGPYVNAGANGMGTPLGHLFNTEPTRGLTTGRIASALFWFGIVDINRLPANSGYAAAVKTALPSIRYEA